MVSSSCRRGGLRNNKTSWFPIWRDFPWWYGYGSIPINTIFRGWTSIYQLFWCSPGVQGFDTLPYDNKKTWTIPDNMLPRPYLKNKSWKLFVIAGTCKTMQVKCPGWVCAIIEQSEWFDKFKAKKVFLELSLRGQTCSQVTSLNLPASVTC